MVSRVLSDGSRMLWGIASLTPDSVSTASLAFLCRVLNRFGACVSHGGSKSSDEFLHDTGYVSSVRDLPQPLILFAQLNPLSCGADLIRTYLLGSPPFVIDLLQNLLIFSTIFTVIGAVAYIKIIERD